jgi:hypothetical protein
MDRWTFTLAAKHYVFITEKLSTWDVIHKKIVAAVCRTIIMDVPPVLECLDFSPYKVRSQFLFDKLLTRISFNFAVVVNIDSCFCYSVGRE